MIYGEQRTIAAHEAQNGDWAYDELLDLEAALMKEKARVSGFWQAQYEAGPLAGNNEIQIAMLQSDQSFDEALAVVRKQISDE